MVDGTLNEKLDNLKSTLKEMEAVLVAFSGGVDSTLLLKVASEVLGSNVLAVTATSETYPDWEIKEAKELAKVLGVKHLVIQTHELSNPDFYRNSPKRCYYCKRELFSKLKEIAQKRGINWIVDGSNCDDNADHRPGMQAAKEFNVRSPLKEAGFTKDEVRQASRELSLSTWDKPSFACLASRFPYGVSLTRGDLARVEEAEKILKSLGIKQVRVRHHKDVARIEVEKDEIPKLVKTEIRDTIVGKLRALGYFYVALDLGGYRSGSLNEILQSAAKRGRVI